MAKTKTEVKKHTEDGGVACEICMTSLQQATFGFAVADVVHGIVGITVVFSMLLKKEVDDIFPQYRPRQNRETGYTKFIREVPYWLLYFLLGGFILQITIGMLGVVGAIFRSSFICGLWIVLSFLASPVTPMTYSLLILGRIYEWVTVGEFVWKMDEEEREMKENLEKKDELVGRFLHYYDNIGEEPCDEEEGNKKK